MTPSERRSLEARLQALAGSQEDAREAVQAAVDAGLPLPAGTFLLSGPLIVAPGPRRTDYGSRNPR